MQCHHHRVADARCPSCTPQRRPHPLYLTAAVVTICAITLAAMGAIMLLDMIVDRLVS